jgi:hypothetical protein
MDTQLLINKQKQALILSNKLKESLKLQGLFDIDWGKGSVTRMVQTKYIHCGQQVYKSWLQQGVERTYLSAKQYESLSGSVLSREQLINWLIK